MGQVRADGASVKAEMAERMCDAIAHRGPDSTGLHVEGPIGLGVRRLRVLDLENGDQPIYNEDGSVAVVLNGEIYNFEELRTRLQASGHRLSTDGDTEVIVHLYEEHGPECVRLLHGMFAIALWDARRRRLLLARDRVGKKPLVYAHHHQTLTFASELGALLKDPQVPRDVDPCAVDAYLALNYVPAPMTAYRAVRKLPPATMLLWEDGNVVLRPYWSLDFRAKREFPSAEEMHEEIREQLRRAVARRLVAEVPLGAFLSGGIDSAAVVATMAGLVKHPVKTFSIGFEHERYNELPQARLISQRYGTDHHEFVVRADAASMIPRLVRHYGEPFGDSSALPSFHLAEMARDHVTVALNGDGGDEAFAGYPRYVFHNVLRRLDRLPTATRRALARLAARVPGDGRIDSVRSRSQRLGRHLPHDPRSRYVAYLTGQLQRELLYTDDLRAAVGGWVGEEVLSRAWDGSSAGSLTDVMLDVDTRTYLPGDLLTKIDIATMAFGLEARSPMLDHEFMEFAASLPADAKVRGREKKVALRAAMTPLLPPEILDSPKRGFELPVASWLRRDLRPYVEDVLLDPRAQERGYFQYREVRRLLDRHVRGEQDHSQIIWSLLMLELWHREFVDVSPSAMSAVD